METKRNWSPNFNLHSLIQCQNIITTTYILGKKKKNRMLNLKGLTSTTCLNCRACTCIEAGPERAKLNPAVWSAVCSDG